ncbi:unnamed protein product [Mytilus coruscus]|uniref:Novel STAND NTPase 3 domain-containing protein n=1 Tax=Mytilus coruscus TaxID=42192 RepID=A0A6J8C6M0_MYTCO|nr:unnamed protein product [Mytilus coruscus]
MAAALATDDKLMSELSALVENINKVERSGISRLDELHASVILIEDNAETLISIASNNMETTNNKTVNGTSSTTLHVEIETQMSTLETNDSLRTELGGIVNRILQKSNGRGETRDSSASLLPLPSEEIIHANTIAPCSLSGQENIASDKGSVKDMSSTQTSLIYRTEHINPHFAGMAMSNLAKEQENFLRYAILIVNHSKKALQDLLELNLKNNHLTFQEFINRNQHEIYHLYSDFRCCQCQNSPQRRKRILFPSEMELLFEINKKIPSHRRIGHNDYCCSYAKVGITSQVLDLSLARCLLMNFCLDVFWFTCLTSQGQTLEQFLNSNKHVIYHLWKNNQNCCQCLPGFIFPCNDSLITENEWKSMFSSQLSPCKNHRKRMSTGSLSICSVGANSAVALQDIHLHIQRSIIQNCSHISKAVDKLVEQRSLIFAHVPEATISESDFKLLWNDTENNLLEIARVCGKETHVKKNLRDLHFKPLSLNMFVKYKQLLHKNMEAINKNVASEHQETRQNKSCKLRKLEDRIESLETSSIEEQGLRKIIAGETLSEIEKHSKDQTYIEIKAVTACVQMLDNSKVLILSGREGSGKSKNSLEILRQIKEKHPETDVIKLKRLNQFSDIIDKDANTIILFEDVFGRITKQFCEDTDVQILDSLYSYISLGNVRVIFEIRNNVKQECQSLLSSHDIFCNSITYLDLNSEEFGLSLKEKESIFINYCTKNKIDIIYKKKSFYCDAYFIGIEEIKVSIIDESEVTCGFSADNKCIVFNSCAVEDMIRSDPYQGFPQCCRLFTQNKTLTKLGAAFFKCPSKILLQEIENMRMEGMDNDAKGLKYVILVYILSNQAISAMSIKNDDHAHQNLFYECYNKTFGVKLHEIIYLYEELVGRYLIIKEQTICFQHLALQDSVLISYCKINPKAIIPLLSIDHLIDIVRAQNYMEQEEEIVIKISKSYYSEFAAKIISLMNSELYDRSYRDRFMESKIITDYDVDLIYELIVCINNVNYTPSSLSSLSVESYTRHYFPLYLLLRNIGKLDDKELTVYHTKDQMCISITIRDKNISLCVDPNIALSCAFETKYIDIIKWLLKNTDHSLIDFENLFGYEEAYVALKYVECVQFLLVNVKPDMIDMTQLFMNVCCSSNNEEKHAMYWMMDNVDDSLIDYDKCIDEMLELDYKDMCIDLILYTLKKVNPKWLDINKVVYKSCRYGSSGVILKVLQNFDHELFEKEELINTMILNFKDEDCVNKIVKLILPWIKYCDINRLVEAAECYRWYSVLELLITHVSDLSIDIVQLIEKIFKCWDDWEEEEGEQVDDHMENVFRLLLKHHMDNIDVANIIMEKACDVGSHTVVEELLMDKFDNISYYLNITLAKCLSRRFDEISVSNDGGYGKLLMLFLQRVNTKFIDLHSVMNDVCDIGHSSAVLWLLENKHKHCFDMRNVMNKVSYHGDLKLVEYLKQTYKAGDFDYKTAMIKACRNSQKKTVDVCKWLWANIDRSMFDMKAALNNASRCNNTEAVVWILTEIETGLYDTEAAMLLACEHGDYNTVDLLLDTSSKKRLDIQSAIIIACRNENNGLFITQHLYERADQTTININHIFSAACKNYRINIVQWIIETCDQNITKTETRNGQKHFIKSLDKNRVDMDQAVTCILDMDAPDQKKGLVNETKIQLLRLILKKSYPSTIHIYKLLTEACKNDWVEIFQWILGRVDHACLNIGEIVNVACRNGAFNIIKWSLENIDMQLVDVDNIMVESCGFGWLECLVLIWKHCNQYKLQEAMTEACTYDRLHIAEWLLQNVHYQLFDIPMLLQEAGRNGWIHIFCSLLQNFHFDKSDMHTATSQALENGHLKIAELVISTVGKECFSFSSFSDNTYIGANKEGVVNFLLHNIDPRCLDIATLMTNACLFGWKDIVTFIVDNDLTSLCDLSLAFNTACDYGELKIAQHLLEKVGLHILTTVDKTMHSVAVNGWDEIAVLLLDKVEHTRLDIGNALITACRHGEIDVAQAILRKVERHMLDVKTALNKACENHMHEELVLWILENIDQEQVDLKTVKIQAIRHKWRKVQFAIPDVDIEDLNQVEQETGTVCIIIS